MTIENVDILIIGSGPGGSVIAKKLSELNSTLKNPLRILIVESGPFYTEKNFNQRELDMSCLYWDRSDRYTADMSTQIAMARCVGGSSIVYSSSSHRTNPSVLEHFKHQYGIEGFLYEDLEESFQEVEKIQNVAPHPYEHFNENNRLFTQACEKLGIPWVYLPRGVNECIGSGFCYYGCVNKRKSSMTQTFLPLAFAGGVELIPNCHIDKLLYNQNRIYGATGTILPTPENTNGASYNPGPIEIQAKLTIIAAGTGASAAILFNSGLDNISPALGKYLIMQPGHNINGIMPTKINLTRGLPKTALTKHFWPKYIIVPSNNHPMTTIMDITGFGLDHKNAMSQFNKFIQWQIISFDPFTSESNNITVKDNRPVFNYTYSDEHIDNIIEAMKNVANMMFEVGATQVFVPPSEKGSIDSSDKLKIESLILKDFFKSYKIPSATAHIQGGCRMGQDVKTSVINSTGKLHNYEGCVVCDASIFPESIKVNPVLTIMAFANLMGKRINESILKNSKEYL